MTNSETVVKQNSAYIMYGLTRKETYVCVPSNGFPVHGLSTVTCGCQNGFDSGWMHLEKTVFSRIPNFPFLSLKPNPHSFFLFTYLIPRIREKKEERKKEIRKGQLAKHNPNTNPII